MFKSVVDAFKKACRQNKFTARDFEYSEDAYKKVVEQREKLEEAMKKQLERVRGLYQAAWSDTIVAWMHVKAMRIFVESVLRFGMPPCFAAFIIQVKSGPQASARKALAGILATNEQAATAATADGGDDEDFYPYVSLSFTPFAVSRT